MHAEQSLSSPVFGRPASQQQDVTSKGILALLLRLRPRYYATAAVRFDNTFYLGFLSFILLVIEILTGLVLFFHYSPHPDSAWQSVSMLADNPLLAGVRDLHRLTAELLMATGLLHLLRVVLCGAYKGPRRLTWVVGVCLLVGLFLMTSSGYVLMYDQEAIAALSVLSGVFAAELFPVAATGGGALLKASYLGHVLILPVIVLALLAIHFYRVHWVHGISLPVCTTARRSVEDRRPVLFWPTVALREVRLALLFSTILVAVVVLAYDAPLGGASGGSIPAGSAAGPWFVLWLQGLLSLCPHPQCGVAVVMSLILLLLLLPWVERRQRRPLGQRPRLLLGLAMAGGALLLLSLLGSGADPLGAVFMGWTPLNGGDGLAASLS